MAFTRDNITKTQTFTRDGATTTIAPPSFNVFNTLEGPASFSLGPDWKLTSVSNTGTATGELKFYYKNTPLLTITESGLTGFVFNSLSLINKGSVPTNTSGYDAGDMIKVTGKLFVLVDTSGNPT